MLEAVGGIVQKWVVPDVGRFFLLRIVPEYKHLGTFATDAAKASRDVTVRLTAMGTAARGFVKRLFPDEEVPDQRKANIATTYILSKGLFHIGTWPSLPCGLQRVVHTRVMRLYRAITCEKWSSDTGTQLTDAQVMRKYNLISPLHLVSLARVQLFGRAVLKAPAYLLQLLAAAYDVSKHSWLGAVQDDVAMLSQLPHFRDSKMASLFRGQGFSMPEWANAFLLHRNKARTALVELIRHPETEAIPYVAHSRWQANLHTAYYCRTCNRAFPTKQQMAVHSFLAHQVRPALRRKVSGTTCRPCLLRFGSHHGLHNHLDKVDKCRQWYLEYASDVDPEILEAEILADRAAVAAQKKKGGSLRKIYQPAGRLCGPIPPGAQDRSAFCPHRLFR